eukprot:5100414-Alexandrium_andersonii.AAC.1
MSYGAFHELCCKLQDWVPYIVKQSVPGHEERRESLRGAIEWLRSVSHAMDAQRVRTETQQACADIRRTLTAFRLRDT